MTKRIIVGGPQNSGKSTLVLSLVEHLRALSPTDTTIAEAIELDVWSKSYVAFRGEIPFEGRPKMKGLDWDWRTPLLTQVEAFNSSKALYVFGDLPGILDHAIAWTVAKSKPDAAIVISSTLDGLQQWTKFFTDFGIPVEHRILTVKEHAPLVVTDMCRVIAPNNPGVVELATRLHGPTTQRPPSK